MQRMDTFKISKRPYAVDLSSFQTRWTEARWSGKPPKDALPGSWDCFINAVWFRRRRGTTVACVGKLWDIFREKPETVAQYLKVCDTGRYGGRCDGRWDGELYWGAQSPVEIQRHLDLLEPMLENYPEIPQGYDGWYVF
jgi:hypothetical protein